MSRYGWPLSAACEPIGQVFWGVPCLGGAARIVSHPLDEFGIVQSKQNCINPIHDLLHEFSHLIITDARQPVPRYLAIRRHDLCVGKVAGLRVWRDTGVNILDACVAHAQDRHAERQLLCYFWIHLSSKRKKTHTAYCIGSDSDGARPIANGRSESLLIRFAALFC